MNRILLKNIMSLMFWFYTGIVVAAPVEEVHRTVEEFSKKSSRERQEEIVRHQNELENLRRDQYTSYHKVRDKEDIVKALKVEHGKKEFIDFLDSNEFVVIKKKLVRLGLQDSIFDAIKDERDVTGQDLKRFYDELPEKIRRTNIKFSEQEIETLKTFLEKTVNLLQEHMNNISVQDIIPMLSVFAQSYEQQYESVRSSFGEINFDSFTNHIKKNIMLYGFLALNILAIILMIVASKSSSKSIKSLAHGILGTVLVVDLIGGCFKAPDACRLIADMASILTSHGRTTNTTTTTTAHIGRDGFNYSRTSSSWNGANRYDGSML